MSPARPKEPARISWAARLTAPRVFGGFTLFLLLAKWPQLDQPPVWDGAMGVFPAAITLARSGFDIAGLLQQPSHFLGGPNVHALSLVTWITGVAYALLGGPEVVLPVLHIAHLLLAAWGLTSLWRIGDCLLTELDHGRLLALGAVVTFSVCPLFLVQAGYLYLELPILAFSAAAIAAWVEGNTRRAALWAMLAAMVKPSGMIVAGALAGSALLSPEPWLTRGRRAAALVAGPLAWAVLVLSVLPDEVRGTGTLRATLDSAQAIPDLVGLVVVFVILSLGFRPWRAAIGWSSRQTEPPAFARASMACAGMAASFIALYAALVPLGASVPVMPRYYVQLIPFCLLGSLSILLPRFPRTGLALLGLLCVFFLSNRNGAFYPGGVSGNFALAERSMEYLDLLEVQNRALDVLLESSQDAPVFYNLPEHYKLAYPEMGYGFEPPSEGHCIFFEPPYFAGRLKDFPDKFFMVVDRPWLGGEVVMKVGREAADDPDFEVSTAPIRVGDFESRLVYVRRRATSLPPTVEP